jgi:hypothetical protein
MHATVFPFNSETVIAGAGKSLFREINDGESDSTRLAHSAVFSILLW